MSSERVYHLSSETDREQWRQRLLKEIGKGDVIRITMEETVSFTQARQLITSLNTVAWQRGASLGYLDMDRPVRPPLPIRYSRPPSITLNHL